MGSSPPRGRDKTKASLSRHRDAKLGVTAGRGRRSCGARRAPRASALACQRVRRRGQQPVFRLRKDPSAERVMDPRSGAGDMRPRRRRSPGRHAERPCEREGPFPCQPIGVCSRRGRGISEARRCVDHDHDHDHGHGHDKCWGLAEDGYAVPEDLL
jgi:hypothetical protein